MEDQMIKEILVSEEQIKKRVKELGEQITKDYQGKEPVVVGILKGAVVFLSDLIREIKIPIHIDFMAVSSYGKSSISTGEVRIIKDLDFSVEDKDIIIIEDIIDTGLTLGYLKELLVKRGADSVKICTLLDKPERRKININVDYIGFAISDEFIIGYGLDYNEKYRNYSFVAALKEEYYK